MKHSRRLHWLLVASAGIGIAALVVAGIWWATPRNGPGMGGMRATATSVQTPITPAAVASRFTPSSAAPARTAQLPSQSAISSVPDFEQDELRLLSMAKSGDAQAAYRLAEVYGKCAHFKPMSAGDLEDAVVSLLALTQSGKDKEAAQKSQRTMRMFKAEYALAERICAGVSDWHFDNADRKSRKWLRTAAARGDPRAMAEFAQSAFAEFKSRPASDAAERIVPLAHAEEIAQRAKLARSYLHKASSMGEPRALMGYASAYERGMLFSADATQAYAYAQAFADTAFTQTYPWDTLAAMIAHRLRAKLSARQQTLAKAQALRIEAEFIEKPGVD